jgi:ABC-type xylose transport system permease subunit
MNQVVKLSTFPRVISCLVMLFAGILITLFMNWLYEQPEITMPISTLAGTVLVPIVGLLKFAFDFAGDGKIDSN